MSITIVGFGSDCITTLGFGCESLPIEKKHLREVLRPVSSIERTLNLDSVLKK